MSELSQGDCGIYIIACVKDGALGGPVKVGISTTPWKRLRSIQTSCPYEARLVHVFVAPNKEVARQLEASFHTTQAKHRTVGEWFNIEPRFALTMMCMNYRAAFAVNCKHVPSGEVDAYLDVAGVLTAEEFLREVPA